MPTTILELATGIRDDAVERMTAALAEDRSRRVVLRRLAAGLTALGVVGVAGRRAAAQDQTPTDTTMAPPAPYRFTLGSFAITIVSDGAIPFPTDFAPLPPGQIFFVDAPPAELAQALREAGLDAWVDTPETVTGTIDLNFLVIDTGQNLVLLDTGFGAGAPFPGAGLLRSSLRTAGIDPADIDTVFISHGHIDHIMGAADGEGNPTFPNARYVMGRTEHAFWTDQARVAQIFPDPAARELQLQLGLTPTQTILPVIESRLELVDEASEMELVPGLRAVAAYGHTPGHTAAIAESDGDTLLITFDAIVHPMHAQYPAWNFFTDTLPNHTETTRRGLLDRAAAEGMLVQFSHFPFPGLGRVARHGDAWRWEPAA